MGSHEQEIIGKMNYYNQPLKDICERLNDLIRSVHAQREEILKAFIAKYKCEPDQAIQVEVLMEDGTRRWFVRKKTDKEMTEESMESAQL